MDGSSSAYVSQFISMDADGVAVLWMTSDVTSDDASHDLGLAPWSRLKLVQVRVLRCACVVPHNKLNVEPAAVVGSGVARGRVKSGEPEQTSTFLSSGSTMMSSTVLAAIPGDVSTFLCSAPHGKVCKLVRYGGGSANPGAADFISNQFLSRAALSDAIIANGNGKAGGSVKVEFFSPVTCISARASISSPVQSAAESGDESKNPDGQPAMRSAVYSPLILVGRADATIDLFQLDIPVPLQSWTLQSKADSTRRSRAPAVVSFKWCSNRASAFIAVNSDGNAFYFDLLQDPFNFIATDSLPAAVPQRSVDLSSCRPGSKTVYLLATRAKVNDISALQVRKLNEDLLSNSTVKSGGKSDGAFDKTPPAQLLANEEVALRESMNRWIGITSESTIAAMVADKQSSNRK
jgi:hypothetical protein